MRSGSAAPLLFVLLVMSVVGLSRRRLDRGGLSESVVGTLLIEMIDEDRGPGLEVGAFVAERRETLRREQLAFEDLFLANTHLPIEREHLCKADVHGADRVRVVVDQPEGSELAPSLEHDLLGELAPGPADERVRVLRVGLVLGVDVAADSDRELAVKTALAALSSRATSLVSRRPYRGTTTPTSSE